MCLFLFLKKCLFLSVLLLHCCMQAFSSCGEGGLLLLWCKGFSLFCDPMDCSPPGSSVHGILHTRILEWVAIAFSRGSSQHMDQTQVSCIAGGFFPV